MHTAQTDDPIRPKPLRLWPGVVVVTLQWLARYGVPLLHPSATALAVLGGLVGGLAVLVWWVFLSRAPRFERWGAVVLMAVAMTVTSRVVHESIATGMVGMMYFVYAVPVLSLAFVCCVVVSRRLSDGPRRVVVGATILLACGVWALFRSGGMTGAGAADFAWRWAPTPEDRLLAQTADERMALRASSTAKIEAEWPGFRGPNRDAVIRGAPIQTDWSVSPPVEMWRRAGGPGCSSFAVLGDLFYTQEQRGDDEVVACYNMTTGEPVWRHSDPVRFCDAHAGAGPRATPTLSDGRAYTFGATGVLNALDARDGSVVWSRDVAAETNADVPDWGFASSPLVIGDVVVVYTNALVAYDFATGDPRWVGENGGGSYSPPHRFTSDSVEQVLMLSRAGATAVAPFDGALLWEHRWPGLRIVQPALTANGDILMSGGEGRGTRRITVARAGGGWTVEERWTSRRLKPYYNDFVVHEGHAFGFDGRILACMDIENGDPRWKGGRYGNGQLVLLADQDLLLVLSEQGELALVAATPGRFTALARVPSIEGKTWNHPALVGDILLVRNGQEMGAFRLPLADSLAGEAVSLGLLPAM